MGGATLLEPRGLWLLAAALPVLVFYILRARRRRVRVPSTLFWASANRDLLARAPWRRLVAEVSLVLELVAVAAVALSFARPAWPVRASEREHVALVIDTSASMGAREADGTTRVELGRRAAARALDALAPDVDVMVIDAGREARVVAPLARDRRPLRAALAGVVARDVEGSLTEAVALAVDRLRPLGGRGRVVVVTDGAVARGEAPRGGAVRVEVVRVGAPVENVALVRMDVRATRAADGAERAQVFALVGAFTRNAAEVEVTVRSEDRARQLGKRRVTLAPGAREPVVIAFPLAAEDVGRGVIAEVTPHDALAVDDVAYGRIPPGPTLPVVLAVREENPWLQRALTSDPGVVLQTVAIESAAEAPPGALVVIDGACPAPLPERDVLIVAPPRGSCADFRVEAPIQAPRITSYATTDARFRFLTMDGVHFAEATPLVAGARGAELLRGDGKVFFGDASTPERQVTVLGVDIARTDWPLRASFVVFVRNVVELARAHRARVVAGGGRAGEPLRVAVPVRAQGLSARGPTGDVPVTEAAGTAVVGETSRAGFYALRWQGGATLVPVNLLSDAESNLLAPPWRGPDPVPATRATQTVPPPVEIAPWLAALAALALLADLWWLTRAIPPTVPRAARGAA